MNFIRLFYPIITRTPGFLLLILPYSLKTSVAAVDSLNIQAAPYPVSWVANDGWSNNSINAIIFRKNSLVSDRKHQYIAYYNHNGYLVVGKRKLNSNDWTLLKSQYKVNVDDAHKSISIMLDGSGYLHVAWGHHNNALHYAKSVKPGSLEIGNKESMTGHKENRVTYPEFYRMPNGDMIFMYRDGGSGNGNLMINHYDHKKHVWLSVQDGLIDGEGQRNAYWQAFVDHKGSIHISWVWRESPNVASNHDMCYARSDDGGKTWRKSTGEVYTLPISASNAEYVAQIPQRHELINQTAMYVDQNGIPYIASYWRGAKTGIPQYHLIYQDKDGWKTLELDFRKQRFSLSGGGTKRIPISRPHVVVWGKGKKTQVGILFRDIERNNRVSLAISDDLQENKWSVRDIYPGNVGEWEPSYDTELWKRKQRLDIYLQEVEQVDGEGKADRAPTPVGVLQWKPNKKGD